MTSLLSLPDDVLRLILSHLHPPNANPSHNPAFSLALSNSRLLHLFRSLLHTLPPAFQPPARPHPHHFRVPAVPQQHLPPHIRKYLLLAGPHLRHATLETAWSTSDILDVLLSHCTHVTTLTLSDHGHLRNHASRLSVLPLRSISISNPAPHTLLQLARMSTPEISLTDLPHTSDTCIQVTNLIRSHTRLHSLTLHHKRPETSFNAATQLAACLTQIHLPFLTHLDISTHPRAALEHDFSTNDTANFLNSVETTLHTLRTRTPSHKPSLQLIIRATHEILPHLLLALSHLPTLASTELHFPGCVLSIPVHMHSFHFKSLQITPLVPILPQIYPRSFSRMHTLDLGARDIILHYNHTQFPLVALIPPSLHTLRLRIPLRTPTNAQLLSLASYITDVFHLAPALHTLEISRELVIHTTHPAIRNLLASLRISTVRLTAPECFESGNVGDKQHARWRSWQFVQALPTFVQVLKHAGHVKCVVLEEAGELGCVSNPMQMVHLLDRCLACVSDMQGVERSSVVAQLVVWKKQFESGGGEGRVAFRGEDIRIR